MLEILASILSVPLKMPTSRSTVKLKGTRTASRGNVLGGHAFLSQFDGDFRPAYRLLLREEGGGRGFLRINVSISIRKTGKKTYTQIDLTCDHWIVNQSLLPLEFMSDGVMCSTAPKSANVIEDKMARSTRCLERAQRQC